MAERSKKKDLPFDGVQQAMGDFGPWQLFIAVSLSLIKFPVAWHQLSIVFIAPPTKFQCLSPYKSIGNNSINCVNDIGNGVILKCEEFQYDRSIFKESIITQWDLVCDRNQLANIVQTLTMFAVLVGNILFGIVADRIGRKIPLMFAVTLLSVSGLASAFSPWYELFLALKFIAALATGGSMLISFVIIVETVGAKWRPILSILFHVPFILGHLTNVLISYLTRTWYGLQIAISVPPILLLSYYWIVPESPRWLLAVGRVDEAREILIKASKRNKINIDNVKTAIESYESNSRTTTQQNENYTLLNLLKTPNLRRNTLCVCANWLTCGICFFGLTQYVGQLSGDIFINVAASAAMELPGTILVLYLISRVSRLRVLISGNVLAGLSLLVLTLVSDTTARVCLATFGLVGMAISFSTVYLYSTEVFPTVVRNMGLGLASVCARVGSMVAPFITTLDTVQPWLPPLIFGIAPLIGAILCLMLPETMDCELPETIEDGENFRNRYADNGGYNLHREIVKRSREKKYTTL